MTNRKKKVLITGANGLLGSNLVRLLCNKYHVRLLVRPGSDLKTIMNLNCEFYYGDICVAEDVRDAVNDCNFVVHAASLTTQWGVTYSDYKRVNITSTKHIVEACLLHKVEKLIYISTANTIGHGSIDKPGNELNAFSLFHINSGYINTKYIAQQYVQEQIESNNLPAVILNPTFMIGAYDAKPSSGQIILYGINKKILFYPPGGKNFVHVNDVCTGIDNAIEQGEIGEMYLLAGQNISYYDFFKILNKISGQNPKMIRIPPSLLKIAGNTSSKFGKITGSSPKLNYVSAYMLCLGNYYSGQKSERELGIKYTAIEDAIKSAYDWFKENNYL